MIDENYKPQEAEKEYYRAEDSTATEQEPAAAVTEIKQNPPNILDRLKLHQALRLASEKSEENLIGEAKQIYNDILARLPKNRKAIRGIRSFMEKIHLTN